MRIKTVAMFRANPKALNTGIFMKFPRKYPAANTTLDSKNHEAKTIS